jgi:hypothetical protein
MAGDWIKWCKGLVNKREIVVLSSRFKRDKHEIAARLMCLWEWCDENMDDTDFEDEDAIMSLGDRDSAASIIDHLTGIDGMSDALQSKGVDWLAIGDHGRVRFKKLRRHNGSTAKQRSSNQRRKSKQRQSEKTCHDSTVTETGQKEDQRQSNSKSETDTTAAASAQCKDRGMQGGKGKASNGSRLRPQRKFTDRPVPEQFVATLDGMVSILGVDRDADHFLDQVGLLAKLAYADASGFAWPIPVWDYLGRAKRKPNPAGWLTHVLRDESPELWRTFERDYPSPTHCQWLLQQAANGQG